MKSFCCRDIGVDCDWKCQASTEQEVLKLAENHALKEHGMAQIDEQTRNKIRDHIVDFQAAS